MVVFVKEVKWNSIPSGNPKQSAKNLFFADCFGFPKEMEYNDFGGYGAISEDMVPQKPAVPPAQTLTTICIQDLACCCTSRNHQGQDHLDYWNYGQQSIPRMYLEPTNWPVVFVGTTPIAVYSASSSVVIANREAYSSFLFSLNESKRRRFFGGFSAILAAIMHEVFDVDHMYNKSIKACVYHVLSDLSVLASGLVSKNSTLGLASCAIFGYSTGSSYG